MTDKDQVMMVEVEPQAKEKTPFVKEGGVVTTDLLMEELFEHRTWRYTLLILSLTLTCLAGPLSVYVVSFAGSLYGIMCSSPVSFAVIVKKNTVLLLLTSLFSHLMVIELIVLSEMVS